MARPLPRGGGRRERRAASSRAGSVCCQENPNPCQGMPDAESGSADIPRFGQGRTIGSGRRTDLADVHPTLRPPRPFLHPALARGSGALPGQRPGHRRGLASRRHLPGMTDGRLCLESEPGQGGVLHLMARFRVCPGERPAGFAEARMVWRVCRDERVSVAAGLLGIGVGPVLPRAGRRQI